MSLRRRTNRSGTPQVYFEKDRELWCCEIRRGARRFRKRARDRAEVEAWRKSKLAQLGEAP